MQIQSLIQDVTQRLLQQHLRIATAESCTGGMLAQYLTSLPGSSQWYDRGWITYSNEAKSSQLGVATELIQQDGAVSEVVAKAMAAGALARSEADLAIAITGITGPDGGSQDKPVGMVCFGWGRKGGEVHATCVQFPMSDREHIRYLSCCEALKCLRI